MKRTEKSVTVFINYFKRLNILLLKVYIFSQHKVLLDPYNRVMKKKINIYILYRYTEIWNSFKRIEKIVNVSKKVCA